MRKNMKWVGLLFLTVALGLPRATKADVDPEVRGGYYTDTEEGFIGGGLLTEMSHTWDFNPNMEWVFMDNLDYYTLNADFHKDINHDSAGPAVWLGAGAAYIVIKHDRPLVNDDTTTDVGLNLFTGIGAKHGGTRPFGQAKVTLADESEFSLAFGLRF